MLSVVDGRPGKTPCRPKEIDGQCVVGEAHSPATGNPATTDTAVIVQGHISGAERNCQVAGGRSVPFFVVRPSTGICSVTIIETEEQIKVNPID